MKFKTQEQLDQYVSQKKVGIYKTDLGEPLTGEEIEVIVNKPNSVTIGESIKGKVSEEEFKFVLGKCRLSKSEKKSLIG